MGLKGSSGTNLNNNTWALKGQVKQSLFSQALVLTFQAMFKLSATENVQSIAPIHLQRVLDI